MVKGLAPVQSFLEGDGQIRRPSEERPRLIPWRLAARPHVARCLGVALTVTVHRAVYRVVWLAVPPHVSDLSRNRAESVLDLLGNLRHGSRPSKGQPIEGEIVGHYGGGI